MVALALLGGCDWFDPSPVPSPSPTPPPVTEPTPPVVEVPRPEEVRVGYTHCCGVDALRLSRGIISALSYAYGWPLINEAGVDLLRGAVDTTELRAGPNGPENDQHDGPTDLSPESWARAVRLANDAGILPVSGWWDAWPPEHGLVPGVTLRHFRECTVPQWYDDHVLERQRLGVEQGLEWIDHTGNELFKAGTPSQTECHERRLIALIRSVRPDAYIISGNCNENLLAEGLVQACDVHGWWPDTVPRRARPGDWNFETDQREPGCDGWMAYRDRVQAEGGVPVLWMGDSGPNTRDCVLDRLRAERE